MRYTSLEPQFRRFFHWYGGFVHNYRVILFIFPLLVTFFLSFGFLWVGELSEDDPAYVFTPKDARWKRESHVFEKLWPLQENKFLPGKSFEAKRFVNILVRAKDGQNVLRPMILDEIQLLNTLIMSNVTVPTDDGRFVLTYQDLCLSYDWTCGANEHIEMFRQMSKVGRVIDLKYPKGGNKDTPAYLGTAIGDIVLNKTDNTVQEAKITQLFYFLKQDPPSVDKYSTAFEYAVEKFLLTEFNSNLIEISFAHYHSLQDGINENAERFVPNFVISFTSLTIFCFVCSFTLKRGKWEIDIVHSKPWLACCGLLNTLLCLISSFGIMMLIGVPYNVVNTIIPFLIIAIGIDDMFIMNACWDQVDKSLPVHERMQLMMENAGVAVSITNITDILSFLIGCSSELPGIQVFCQYAFASVVFCYVYQMTFFAGFQAILGEVEKAERNCFIFTKVNPVGKPKKTNAVYANETIKSSSNLKKTPESEPYIQSIYIEDREKKEGTSKRHTASDNVTHRFFCNKYGPFLLKRGTRTIVVLVYVVYIVVAILGCVNFKEGLEPKNLVTSSHYIAKYFNDLKLFWKIGPQLQVAVLDPPNFTDPIQREKLMAMVRSFEDTDYTLGREGTIFFFLEYLNYLDQLNAELENTDRIWNQKLRSWLKYTGGSNQWDTDIVFNKTTNEIIAFRFQLAMKDIVEPNQHKLAAKLLREIADKQPFHVEIYQETFPFADQYLIILPSTYRNVGISLLCMTLIAFLLIPSIPSAILIVLSIVSISAGVFGYMTFWRVHLDAVSMISIIMSIGFAVDLSAHIVYAFVTSHGEVRDRVIGALEHLGWPIFQGAASTIAGISILYTVNAYIILTFFKTIWLTMVLGMIHGLVFIPVMLSFIPLAFFQIQEDNSKVKEVKEPIDDCK
ncbi:unnamed protein product [Bursaphelenchus xylophilus]|uniref:(pine wood nematode) hypothetical protein n=1 Tax=Bursaphelenchus xylophilus TaxID=6326 RepID=A0A1I7STF8_BURXY|nr:unnamed protein product [Bursaphelenchus xylophilus]CAG9108461.1 unnamed protein product [Bursaphelenchus xylophilus]